MDDNILSTHTTIEASDDEIVEIVTTNYNYYVNTKLHSLIVRPKNINIEDKSCEDCANGNIR